MHDYENKILLATFYFSTFRIIIFRLASKEWGGYVKELTFQSKHFHKQAGISCAFLYPLSRGYKKTQTESFKGVPRIVAYAFPRVLLLVSWSFGK